MQHDARGHRKRYRHPAREEDLDGLRRKSVLPQKSVSSNGRYMVVSIVRVGTPAFGRRNETFGDHVPDLPFGRAGERRELANVHDRNLSTMFLSKQSVGSMAALASIHRVPSDADVCFRTVCSNVSLSMFQGKVGSAMCSVQFSR